MELDFKQVPLIRSDPLTNAVEQSLRALQSVGGQHWVVTYSGGKDSTLTTILAVETFRRWPEIAPASLDIFYSDTLVEIPPLHEQALAFLNYVESLAAAEHLPIHVHIIVPPVKERFWYLILGKGYPPPHRAFWWCTRRLKIDPIKNELAHLQSQNGALPVVVLTGVRVGESQTRDRKIASAKAKACIGQGECGQTLMYQGALAPILHWKTCQVWDFLRLFAPSWGWPTARLVTIYDQANTRFGCWACTVVKQERALAGLVEREEWAYLAPLQAFRRQILSFAATPNKRVRRPNGKPGKFTLEARRELLDALLKAQEKAGIPLIQPEEIQAIQAFWDSRAPEEHNSY